MRISLPVLVTMLVLSLAVMSPRGGIDRVSAAPVGQITLTISCDGRLERTTIANLTNEELQLTGWTLGTIVRPRGNEPFALSGRLAAGAQNVYESGTDAIPSTKTFAEIKIYDDDPQEGAVLETPYGSLRVMCSTRAGSLRVGVTPETPTPTATTVAIAQATSTASPTVVPGSTSTATGVFSWFDRPPIGTGGTLTCPGAGQWFLLYAAGLNGVTISSAATTCANSDLFWVFRAGRWLGFSKLAPDASDTWGVGIGEAHFIRGN